MASYNRRPGEIILHLMALSGFFVTVNGRLLKTLEDTVVLVNDSIWLTCQSTISEEIHFYYNGIRMYAGGTFYKPYKDRFKMDITGNNTYTLVNEKAGPEDAGVYKCWDDEARGRSSSANLTVLNSRLLCETSMNAGGYIGSNTCNLQQEKMIFNCSVSFNGKPPRLAWITSNGNRLINSPVCDRQPDRINCQLTLTSDSSYDGTVFTCQTDQQPNGVQYNCSTGVIKVQYFALDHELKPMEKIVDEEVECSVRSNLNPRFKWSMSQDNEETVVSNTRQHVIRENGLHWCNVSYNIGDVQCSSLASVINARNPVELTALHAFCAITALLLLTSTVVGALFIYKYKKLRAYYGDGGVRHYYMIRSKLNDLENSTDVKKNLVLDIEGGNRKPGTSVITWEKKESDRDNQLWYDDEATGTIRSKLNDLCLDANGEQLVVRAFQPGDQNQQWMRSENFIRNRIERNKCLGIKGSNKNPEARLCSEDHNESQNQLFDFEYVKGREFYIVSEMNKKVMDIDGEKESAVIMSRKKSPLAKSQLWYADQQGVIRSALNDFALHGNSRNQQLKMYPFDGSPEQMWRFQGRRIVNQYGVNCLDIEGGSKYDGAKVIVYDYNDTDNQHWSLRRIVRKEAANHTVANSADVLSESSV